MNLIIKVFLQFIQDICFIFGFFSFERNFFVKKSQINKNILMLQGPVGPFFYILKRYFENYSNSCVWQVCFNFSDRLFSSGNNRFNFNGDINEWEAWLNKFLVNHPIDLIILFGTDRKIHEISRIIAKQKKISLLSLEEGYIRNGYITAEFGGNNLNSPIAKKMPPKNYQNKTINKVKIKPGFVTMCIYGAIYYTLSNLFTFGKQRLLFHRKMNIFIESLKWINNFIIAIIRKNYDSKQIEKLVTHHHKNFYLIPLQVKEDSQLKNPAYNWDSKRLVIKSIESFAYHAPKNSLLVFKVHPLDRGHFDYRNFCQINAKKFNVENRVYVIEKGVLGILTNSAIAMITINSTSGLSAISYGIPLLAIGDAIYANETLVTCAKGKPNFDIFWSSKHLASLNTRKQYLNWLSHESLLQGDLYTYSGIKIACKNILSLLKNKQILS